MGFVRRSGRIAKEIRILLMGTDTSGRVFSEETHTVTLSRHGAGIVSKYQLAPDGILTMRFLGGSTEASLRLVGQLGEDVRGYVYGVTFVDPDLDFWELKFPPPPQWRVDFQAPLQCISCQTREVVDQSEIEADVYALAEFILRFCPNCGMTTQWRLATEDTAKAAMGPKPGKLESRDSAGDRPLQPSPTQSRADARRSPTAVEVGPPEPMPVEPLSPAATATIARTANRRRDVRTKVSFTACVRQEGEEEIVECGNVSKGGFSFRSRKTYLAGAAIEVALPFYPGTQPMFVSAVIRHSVVLPNNNFHYGAIYAAAIRNLKS